MSGNSIHWYKTIINHVGGVRSSLSDSHYSITNDKTPDTAGQATEPQ
jgi:hypothetical protein